VLRRRCALGRPLRSPPTKTTPLRGGPTWLRSNAICGAPQVCAPKRTDSANTTTAGRRSTNRFHSRRAASSHHQPGQTRHRRPLPSTFRDRNGRWCSRHSVLAHYRLRTERARVVVVVLMDTDVSLDEVVAPSARRAQGSRVLFDCPAPNRSGSSSRATRWRARYSRVVIVASGAPRARAASR
jgi:hypothetical protein